MAGGTVEESGEMWYTKHSAKWNAARWRAVRRAQAAPRAIKEERSAFLEPPEFRHKTAKFSPFWE